MEVITSPGLYDHTWKKNSIAVEIASQDGNHNNLNLKLTTARPNDHQILFMLEPASDILSEMDGNISRAFQGFCDITKAINAPDIEAALNSTLKSAASLTQASLLAVYLAREGEPVYTRTAESGDFSPFPAKLTDLELDGLQHTNIWFAQSRPNNYLDRIARKHGLNYLAIQMLGEKNATIGFLVVGDEKRNPVQFLSESIKVIGSGITALVQIYASRSELHNELSRHQSSTTVYEQVYGSINEGVLLIDPGNRILELNSSAEIILGYDNSEARGESIENVLIGEGDLSALFTPAKTTGMPSKPENYHLYRRNGEKFLATARVVPIMVEDTCLALAVLLQDLTEQEEIRNRAQQYEQRATLGEVTAMFAHEMRNMINNISTTLQLMNRQVIENETHRKYIQQMLEECDRLSSQVTAVLEIAKPKKYEMVALDVPQLLNRMLDRYRARILRARVQCEVILSPDCPKIEGNQYALEEVFGNLISNALEAMDEEGGRLVLRLQPVLSPEGKSFVQVAVADTAPGIPPEFREHIFQPFYTTKKKGTGLGLAITKAMVSAHRGNIRVEFYTPGTIFYVQLPAFREKEE